MNKLTFYRTPYEKQREVVDTSYQMTECLLRAEQGCGKTKLTLDTAVNLYLDKKINCLIVIVPKPIVSVWLEEVTRDVSPDIDVLTHYYYSSKANSVRYARMRNDFLNDTDKVLRILVMPPDSLLTKVGAEFFDKVIDKYAKTTLLAIDESGRILKNHRTKRAKKLLSLKNVAYKRCLTGTPITHSPMDLWAQCTFLRPGILGRYFTAFKARYCVLENQHFGARSFSKIVGYKNLDELKEKVDPILISIKKSDILDLPEKIYTKAYCELTPEQTRLYNDLKKNSVAFPNAPADDLDLVLNVMSGNYDKMSTNNALTKLLRLQQIVIGYLVLDDKTIISIFKDPKDNPRIKLLQYLLEDCERKVLIWCRFMQDIRDIKTVLGDECVVYHGSLNDAARADALHKFKTDERIKYFVANPACAGMGLTLTEADTSIDYSSDFSLEHKLQRDDRLHRIGQKHTVRYISMLAEDTVDMHIASILKSKMRHTTILD